MAERDGTVRGMPKRDHFLDFVLDELTEAAGLQRGTSAFNLARWDLKAAIERGLAREEKADQRTRRVT